MEDMEIDQIVDVLDTPDRSTSEHVIRGKHVNSGLADKKSMNELRGRDWPTAENGNGRRLVIRPQKHSNSDNEIKNCSNSFAVSEPKKYCALQSVSLFRRAYADKNLSQEPRHSNEVKKMEKGKAICTKIPSKSSFQVDVDVLDLTEENGQFQTLKTAFPDCRLKGNGTKMRGQKASSESSSLHFTLDSPVKCGNDIMGKEKINHIVSKGPGLALDRGKRVDLSGDSQHQNEKQIYLASHPFLSPSVNMQKRLVQNGCISPHNIATRAKQSEQNGGTSINVAKDNADSEISSNTPFLVDISDIVSEEKSRDRVKGKGVLVNPSTSNLHDATIHPPSRNPRIIDEDADGASHTIRHGFGCSGGLAGWRTTHDHLRNTMQTLPGVLRQSNNRVERGEAQSSESNRALYSHPEDHLAQATSLIVSEPDRVTGAHPAAITLNKRQRKRGLTLRNHTEGSKSVSCDSELVFLHSYGESSNPRIQIQQPKGMLDTEVIELSPETRHAFCANDTSNNGSDARARQVEADEILALELQEQLYHEELAVGGSEMDEHLAWGLQHEEEVFPTSVGSHLVSHPRWSSHTVRNPRSRSYQNPPNRRAQAQVPVSNRMARRSHILSQSPRPRVSTRGRSVRFPFHMDLDMRLDILEAFEGAVGDISDMGMADDIFQVQRDFNENDYEMLLALDDNNHRHAGASGNQINSLPQTTIQTNTFEEACAICLETPTMGETIRHLPCLHKFHKGCIDPWLRRRTSCPVCKSSAI
ncbi:E3 ubiquitin-protein ligase SDIR1 [Quillaja saponaria]|uniref:E3 ubiquitin-protein ligase SDIR1 n=1 Tax=Quillaja saponaria TaxID=32244 RepID=A0AAD7PI36_QUISA|nr:E3 ubiquitin-protein ligase SDIR1 [Quillaja saponaria]